MGKDKSSTNIIAFGGGTVKPTSTTEILPEMVDASSFIVDMLDRLMRIATRQDQTVLVYLLAMARIEAMEATMPTEPPGRGNE